MHHWHNPNHPELTVLLREAKTIAIVGCSPKPDRPSHQIAAFLQSRGYDVIPVHPQAKTILGQNVYPSLAEIPVTVDIVNVFLRAASTPAVAEEAVRTGAGALWLQQDIISDEAYRIATGAGLTCIMDLCIAVMHRLLLR
ncbi:CoA-binding protein [Mariprofundus erugo]|uniref:CoA-binding protein n=1 Tax=Mariprofundus erugo TaxID=2528639 RepID=A0A5R9GUD2_9PROT|nr:CoA-binding protein [Mariprofundus erugo]TLS68499.1 CoA-binding protein [Mariprofundus erugo]TLS76856.1 CoA-binding protein [Mariprofundus erugo]